ncbi:hypothetical protein M2284_002770 [Rhodococcus sp. LBL1]|nr:hypothetical protein [Rhodococcus sp. LBL1]MDH6684565.1 hypothetical protein [Rhodococcus sp. LBL2]
MREILTWGFLHLGTLFDGLAQPNPRKSPAGRYWPTTPTKRTGIGLFHGGVGRGDRSPGPPHPTVPRSAHWGVGSDATTPTVSGMPGVYGGICPYWWGGTLYSSWTEPIPPHQCRIPLTLPPCGGPDASVTPRRLMSGCCVSPMVSPRQSTHLALSGVRAGGAAEFSPITVLAHHTTPPDTCMRLQHQLWWRQGIGDPDRAGAHRRGPDRSGMRWPVEDGAMGAALVGAMPAVVGAPAAIQLAGGGRPR